MLEEYVDGTSSVKDCTDPRGCVQEPGHGPICYVADSAPADAGGTVHP